MIARFLRLLPKCFGRSMTAPTFSKGKSSFTKREPVRWTVACRRSRLRLAKSRALPGCSLAWRLRAHRRQHHKFFRRKNCNESPRVTKPHPPRCGFYLFKGKPEIRTIKCNRTRFAKEYFPHLRKYLFFLLYPNEDVREQNQHCGSCHVADYVLSNNIDTMQRVNDTMEQDT